MSILGDLTFSTTLHPSHKQPLPTSVHHSVSKVELISSLGGGPGTSRNAHNWPGIMFDNRRMRCSSKQYSRISGDYQLFSASVGQEAENSLLNASNMSFFQRLNLAWKIIFPPPATIKSSNARIAKQRLKMILFSDRCAVSDEVKQKIVKNIVNALSEFVEIESQDKVQLSVTADTDIGTLYSVTVPVRRVKPEYQDAEELASITNIEYKENGETSGSVDVRFDFYIPEKRSF